MKNESIAIVGIGAIFPGAEHFVDFWNNSLESKCFVREVPDDFWIKELFYDADPTASDKTYSKNAGVVGNVEFNPMEFGIPPKTMQSISVEQIYGLVLTRQALIDAGLYGKDAKPFDKSRTGVIMSASVGKNAYHLSTRTNAPLIENFMRNCNVPEEVIKEVITNYKNGMLEWTEASNPGYLANVVSGRIANRFDFKGTTCCVDAACASSLAAIKFACQELLVGDCDVMIAGGVNLDLSNTSFVSFCKTPAISKTDTIRPFDRNADGMILGDGTGAIVLKRLSTAEADNDRIYAVIEGIGSSSDGQEKSIFSPNQEGQVLAVKRALEKAEVKPDQIGLIEAHGTGTLVGDTCEVQSMKEIFGTNDEKERKVVISGCKGQIGHLRLAAGVASMIHATLSLYHKQFLPATGCEELNDALKESIFHVCKKPMPWIVNQKQPVRYATVSAFGFGGTNYNLVLKEYRSDYKEEYRYTSMPKGILLEAKTKDELVQVLELFISDLKESKENLEKAEYTYRKLNNSYARVGFVSSSSEDAIEKAEFAIKMLQKSNKNVWNIKGILYAANSLKQNCKLTTLFSGQGSQYCHMLSSVAGAYPELRESLTIADNELIRNGNTAISDLVYPKAWSKEEIDSKEDLLSQTQYTQPALASIEAGLYKILKKRGFETDFCIGHSFGELVALYATGAYDELTLMKLAYLRGSSMAKCAEQTISTGMVAVKADYAAVKKIIQGIKDIYIANQNSPEQIIVAGSDKAIDMLLEKGKKDGIQMKRLNVSAAFHTPYMSGAKEGLGKELKRISLRPMKKQIFSNYTAKPYRNERDIVVNLTEQLVKPVLFEESVKKAYENGSRIFVEIGPGSVLKGLVEQCLSDKEDIVVIATDSKENDLMQLETTCAHLAVLGLPIIKDIYEKKLSEEVIVKKQKNTYSVPPTYFILPDELKRMLEARDKKKDFACYTTMVCNQEQKNENDLLNNIIQQKDKEKKKKENEDMNKYDAMYEIQKVNAGVVADYVKFQKEQFDQMKELLQTDFVNSEENKKLLFDYISNFQNNCLSAVRSYFNGQGGQSEIIVYEDERESQEFVQDSVNVNSYEMIEEKDRITTPDVATLVSPKKAEASEVVIAQNSENSKLSKEEVRELVLKTIADITGYPDDLLEEDMSLEGDLGIDSIKRLELFASINDDLDGIFGQDDMVTLAVIQTIEESIDVIKKILDDPNHVAWSKEDIEAAKEQLI